MLRPAIPPSSASASVNDTDTKTGHATLRQTTPVTVIFDESSPATQSADIDQRDATEPAVNPQVSDPMKNSVLCQIVDVLPNGTYVIEGKKEIESNDTIWFYSLTGQIDPDAITPAKTVSSSEISNLTIKRTTSRPGKKHRWTQSVFDLVFPF